MVGRGVPAADETSSRSGRVARIPAQIRVFTWHAPRYRAGMASVLYDLRYALRNAFRAPGFFLTALLALGIGTGANATVFSFINALLLRPVAGVGEPSTLAAVYTSDFSSGPYGDSSYPDYLTLKQDATAFEGLAAYSEGSALIRAGAATERVRRMAVSPEFFTVLRVRAAAGRTLTAPDFSQGAPGVVIGDGLWRRAFDADPATVGRTVVIDDKPHTVVGIASPSFTGLTISRFDIWVPLADSITPRSVRDDRGLAIVGRLADNASVGSAQAQVVAIAARLAQDYPETNRGTLQSPQAPRPMLVVPQTRMPAEFRGQVMALGGVLLGAVFLVLLIACANVASLMLARATAREREVAIRLSLGAGRRRVAQQMLTESLVLGAAGCIVGVLFALWTADVLPSFFPREQAELLDASVDARVFAYTAVVSILAAVLFGMAPAIQAFRTPSTASLRSRAGEASARGGGLRRSLIAGQIALATVLLVSAGLLVQSLLNSLSADLGFGARHALLTAIELPGDDPTGSKSLATFDATLQRVRALPGVESATITTALPLNRTSRRGFRIEGYVPQPGEDREFPYLVVDADYFRTLQIPVVEGRAFDARDGFGGARVAMVNALFADRYFAGHAVGRRITDSRGVSLEVIGVVPTGKYRTVHETVPTVFFPFSQAPQSAMSLVARTTGDPMQVAAATRAAVLSQTPDAAVYRVRSLDAHVAEALGGERLTASLVATCGGLALVLALIGVYGVVSYAVGSRIREIGLRVALGAAPSAIVRLVLREGLRVLVTGLVLGLAAAAASARLLQSMLYGVTPLDAGTFCAVIAALAVATTLAASLPARRALGVDPMVALRHE